jgi:RND family efflux transporter MFP subunit
MSGRSSGRGRLLAIGVAVTLAIGVAAVILIRAGEPSAEAASQRAGKGAAAGAALTVSTIHPAQVLWPEEVTANGAITPWQEASVGAEVAGVRLIDVLVDVGDQVKAGQLLAQFDPAPMQAVYAQQQAGLAEAEARLAEAVANSTRAEHLRESQTISEQDLIRAVTTTQAARAQVDLARARLESQRLALDNTRVLAPDDGVISSRSAMLGAVAAPGMELFRLVRQNRLEWRAELTGADIAPIEIGDRAVVTLPDGNKVHGTVRQIAPVLDAGTRIGIVYVALDADAAQSDARAGMFVAGKIFRRERPGLALPSTALVLRDGFAFVFVVGEEQRAIQTKVATGRRFADSVEIVDGVQASDAVIASGGAFLTDGDRVHVVAQPVVQAVTGAAS